MTDPIADMLTRIRNANMKARQSVDIPRSILKLEIARVLREEGFIKDYREIEDKKQGIIRVYLKYGHQKERVIHELLLESKPGRRIYKKADEIGKVLAGMGIAILSTSRGVMSDKGCKRAHVGGQLICKVW